MNKPNNKKRKNSQEKIKKVFLQLIQNYEIHEISVSHICKLAQINRSTFYTNYLDIYDLADKIKEEMYQNLLELYQEEVINKKHSYDYLKLFKHIKENQIYYKTLFKLNIDFTEYLKSEKNEQEMIKYYKTSKNMDYHIEYFKAGMDAILKKWLNNNCQESPEEMIEILKSEYQKKEYIPD